MTGLHDAAFRAGVWQVIEQRAKELKDQAKAELAALEVGDTVAGRHNGHIIAKVSKAKGRTKLVVTDESALLKWLAYKGYEGEVVKSVNPAYLRHIEQRAKDLGQPIDANGELVPGVELVESEPYVTVRREKDAPFVVAQLLAGGRLSLDGIQALEPAPEPRDRYTTDRIAAGLQDD